MNDADEAAELAVAAGVAGEDRNPPAAELLQAAAFPVATALQIEMRGDQPLVGRDIGLLVGRPEEAIVALPVRQPDERHQLQPVKRNMGAAEIDRSDARRIAHRVGQHVAAARVDRHDMAVGAQLERLEIDFRIRKAVRTAAPGGPRGSTPDGASRPA